MSMLQLRRILILFCCAFVRGKSQHIDYDGGPVEPIELIESKSEARHNMHNKKIRRNLSSKLLVTISVEVRSRAVVW